MRLKTKDLVFLVFLTLLVLLGLLLLLIITFCWSLLPLLLKVHIIRSIRKIIKVEARSINSILLHVKDVLSNDFRRFNFVEERITIYIKSLHQSLVWSFWFRRNDHRCYHSHLLQIFGIQNSSSRCYQIFSTVCIPQSIHKARSHQNIWYHLLEKFWMPK